MGNFYRDEDLNLKAVAGAGIKSTIAEAIEIASLVNGTVSFGFNGVTITVDASSNAKTIRRDWRRALLGYIDKNVGPHPNETLSADERANDARIKAENGRQLPRWCSWAPRG